MRSRALSVPIADEFTPWERETLEVFLILGHEVAATALARAA